jgi:hypothetical protein
LIVSATLVAVGPDHADGNLICSLMQEETMHDEHDSSAGPQTPAQDRSNLSDGRVTRRHLMAAAGIGAAAGALHPLVTSGRAAFAAEESAALADAPVPRMLSGERYPIGMWWPPHPFETNDSRYREIADAGFTFLIGGNYLNDDIIGRWALARSESYRLDFIPVDPDLTCFTHRFNAGGAPEEPFMLSDAEVREGVRATLGRYPSSAFGGINLYDEPGPAKFATLAKYVAAVRELAPAALPYINLFPSNDINYYRGFVQTVAPAVLSFDRYPLLLNGDDQGWFDNLAIVRTVALEAGIPYWTFIQSIKYANHRMPTAAELSWEIGIALAYGYKGIQYFTYWTPDPARGEAFEPALVTVDGELTPLWYAAKSINPVLQYVGTRILPLTSQSVAVSAVATPPAGLPTFTADDWIADATGDAVVIGQFATSSDATERTLVVTNWSHDKTARATLTPASAVDRVVVEERPGWQPPRTVSGPVRLSLPAGSFALVTLARA